MKNMPLDSIGIRARTPDAVNWYTNYREFWERVEREKKKAGR